MGSRPTPHAYTVANTTTAYLQRETCTRLTGLTAALRGETRVTDANNQITTTTTTLDRGAATLTTTTVPGSSSAAVAVTIDGLKASETTSTGATTTYAYDSLGRLSTVNGRESVMEERLYYDGATLVRYIRNAFMRPSLNGRGQAVLLFKSKMREVVFTEVASMCEGSFVVPHDGRDEMRDHHSLSGSVASATLVHSVINQIPGPPH